MVLLHVKRGDSDEFLHECPHTETVGAVLSAVVELHNRRKTIEFVADNVLALGQYGPMRPEAERGLEGTSDPTGIRVGTAPDPPTADTLQRVANDSKAAVHNRQAQARVVLTADALDECEMNMKGAITIAYPQGLPQDDVLRQYQDHGRVDVERLGNDYMNPDDVALWFAGKRWERSQPVSDYLGKNAKTKVIVRLQRLSSGAPVREPAVDKETQKAMMAYYHKKQEEQKRLADDSQDSYLNSDWANPKQIKQQFHGLNPGSIKWRP